MYLYGFYQVSSPIGHTQTKKKKKEMLERSDIKATSFPRLFSRRLFAVYKGSLLWPKIKNKNVKMLKCGKALGKGLDRKADRRLTKGHLFPVFKVSATSDS